MVQGARLGQVLGARHLVPGNNKTWNLVSGTQFFPLTPRPFFHLGSFGILFPVPPQLSLLRRISK